MADSGQKFVPFFNLRFNAQQFFMDSEPLSAARNFQNPWNKSTQDQQSSDSKQRAPEPGENETPDHHWTVKPNVQKSEKRSKTAQKEKARNAQNDSTERNIGSFPHDSEK